MKTITPFLSSRNNYDMLPIFLKNANLEDYPLFNVDDKSTPEEIEKGKELCKLHNIPFIHSEGRGLQWAWQTAINQVSEDVKFVIWCTHDMHPLTENFFKKLDQLSQSGKLDEFGIIGFNTFGPQCHISNIENIKPNTCGIMGKAPLSNINPGFEAGGKWFKPQEMNLPWSIFGKPFTVDSPTDMCWMINVKLFKQYINPTDEFHLFNAPEDVSLQFLYNNVHNIVLPEFVVWHNQYYKAEVNIPVKSAQAAREGDEKHFGHWGKFYTAFKNRWGWERDNPQTFELVKEHYKGTLIYDLYHHDYNKGPLKTFDL